MRGSLLVHLTLLTCQFCDLCADDSVEKLLQENSSSSPLLGLDDGYTTPISVVKTRDLDLNKSTSGGDLPQSALKNESHDSQFATPSLTTAEAAIDYANDQTVSDPTDLDAPAPVSERNDPNFESSSIFSETLADTPSGQSLASAEKVTETNPYSSSQITTTEASSTISNSTVVSDIGSILSTINTTGIKNVTYTTDANWDPAIVNSTLDAVTTIANTFIVTTPAPLPNVTTAKSTSAIPVSISGISTVSTATSTTTISDTSTSTSTRSSIITISTTESSTVSVSSTNYPTTFIVPEPPVDASLTNLLYSLLALIILVLIIVVLALVYKFMDVSPINGQWLRRPADALRPPKLDNLIQGLEQKLNYHSLLVSEFNKVQHYGNAIKESRSQLIGRNENQSRNRFVNILPFDDNNVKLKVPRGHPPGTYVNASLIKFPRKKEKFLAVQAPKRNMISSFWQMILDYKVPIIVMLTKLKEDNKDKATQYWPDPREQINTDGIEVQSQSELLESTFTRRELLVRDNRSDKFRMVQQFHMTSWPDFSVPSETTTIMNLVKMVRSTWNVKRDGPIVVHCSAGVGRTGSFIAIYSLYIDIINPKIYHLSIEDTVKTMRRQRMHMVQKQVQYDFVAQCVLDLAKDVQNPEEESDYYMMDTSDENNEQYEMDYV